jgi:hypothetical protein
MRTGAATALGALTDRGLRVQLLAVALAGVTASFSLVAQRVLPDRYFLDGQQISWVMNSPVGSANPSPEFRAIAAFYRLLGLSHSPAAVALLTLLLFTATVFAAARWEGLGRFGLVGVGVLVVNFVCAAAYLSQYSKEMLTLLLVLLLMLLPPSRVGELVFVGLALVYAALFRPYWGIVAALYVVWRGVLRRRRPAVTVVVAFVLLYLGLQLVFGYAFGTGLTDNRTAVNASRVGVDVASLITDPLPPGPFFMTPNALLALVSLLAPVPLLLKPPVFHAVSAVMIGFLWGATLPRIFRPDRRQQPVGAVAGSRRLEGLPLRAARASAVLVAVVSVQAIFEPDFGSYLKHLTPLMPLFLTLVPLRTQNEGQRPLMASDTLQLAESGSHT